MQATLSHYRVLEQIGCGGMGVVYRAHDERLERDVALKVLPAGALADEAARKRFKKEALALSKLNHPNIATVFDFDSQDGMDFLVEELISGLSLSEMLVPGPLPEDEIINLGSQLVEGLAAAHEQGVIHRDLKPSNVRVTPDARLKILDFGLAKVLHPTTPGSDTDATVSLTETQTVSGTLPYMAPEQLLNEKLDARTDIWAAGCVLYEMATGQRPFLGSGPVLIDAILHQPLTTPSKRNRKVSPGLEAIILKCLEKDPGLRYGSAREIAVDLHRLQSAFSMIRVLPRPRSGRAPSVVIGSVLVTALALATFVVWRLQHMPSGNKVLSAQVPPSIAVLPFEDMSPGKDQQYFSDGLAEELLNDLAKIPGLQVTARTSSFQFRSKNEDLRTIADKLHVATILEGSVRKQGNRVRITAQLIKASDGFHMWSETYDRELKDIFSVQEEIARSVAASLKVTLFEGKATAATRATNPEAYNLSLQGRYFLDPATKESLEKGIGYYEQAVKLDPGYAPAWVGLARAHYKQVDLGSVPPEEGFRKAREAAERALTLDSNLAEAHGAVGWIKENYDWDWSGADASYQRALALAPENVVALRAAADLYSVLGRFDEALTLDRRAVQLDPLDVTQYNHLGRTAYFAGRLQEATAAFNKALELYPGWPYAHWRLGLVYLALARPQKALAEMQLTKDESYRLHGQALAYHALGKKPESDATLAELITKYQTLRAYQIAEVYAFRGEVGLAFEWLDRAYTQHDSGLCQIKGNPLLKNLERDPRYTSLLKKMRLPLN